jgi:hypothetical protein
MEKVTGYLSADGTFFAHQDECLRHERERLRFAAISQKLDILLQPSMTGQKPDVRPEIIDLLDSAGAWDIDSALCSFLMHIRQLLSDNDNHDQLDALIGIVTYLVVE